MIEHAEVFERKWEEGDFEPVVLPEPTVRARPMGVSDLPAGPKKIYNAATKAGYSVSARYAKGPWLHADGVGYDEDCESIVLRGSRGQDAFVATWIKKNHVGKPSWKSETAYYPGSLGPVSVTELKERITQT